MERTVQRQRVLKYMQDFGSITQLEALSELGVMRLASRITDLKQAGYCFNKEWVETKNRYGEKVRFLRYSLAGDYDDERKC